MPLAFTQEDFLVTVTFIVINMIYALSNHKLITPFGSVNDPF